MKICEECKSEVSPKAKKPKRHKEECSRARFKIVRYYKDVELRPMAVRGGSYVTLNEAQVHCGNPLTKKEDVWFDGYIQVL